MSLTVARSGDRAGRASRGHGQFLVRSTSGPGADSGIEGSGGASAMNPPKDQQFKPFVPGASKGAAPQSNESDMNDL